MISEDLCVLATLKTGRPVKWEFTREEQFIGATTRHQMTTRVKLGAKRDGTLTAIDVHVVSNTGAYGGHASETLACSLGGPLTAYRCANKKALGYAVYTNMVPGGGFRGYGGSQTTFAIELAIDELARLLGMDPFEIRRKNMVRPGDWIELVWKDPTDTGFGSYGLDQCLDLVEKALASEGGNPKPTGDDWMEGTGIAMAMVDSGPPTEHRSGAQMALLADGSYHLAVGSTEMGNGSVTSHRQIAASILGARADSIAIINADTDLHPTTPAPSRAPAPSSPARRWLLRPPPCGTTSSTLPAAISAWPPPPAASMTGRRSRPEADRIAGPPYRRHASRPPLRGQAQVLPVAAFGCVRCPGHPARGAPYDRRNPHPAQRARRRHRASHQSHAVSRPDRGRDRHGVRLGAHGERGHDGGAPW